MDIVVMNPTLDHEQYLDERFDVQARGDTLRMCDVACVRASQRAEVQRDPMRAVTHLGEEAARLRGVEARERVLDALGQLDDRSLVVYLCSIPSQTLDNHLARKTRTLRCIVRGFDMNA